MRKGLLLPEVNRSRRCYSLKVLSLERILASKIAANRAKDKLTIPVLRDALLAMRTFKRRAKRCRAASSRRKRRPHS